MLWDRLTCEKCRRASWNLRDRDIRTKLSPKSCDALQIQVLQAGHLSSLKTWQSQWVHKSPVKHALDFNMVSP